MGLGQVEGRQGVGRGVVSLIWLWKCVEKPGVKPTRGPPDHDMARPPSKQNGRQMSSRRFVVESHRHQRQRLHDAKPTLEAPTKQFSIAARDKNARSLKSRRRGNQSLQIFVRLANRVPPKRHRRGIRSHAPIALGNNCRAMLNRILQLAPTFVPVNSHT